MNQTLQTPMNIQAEARKLKEQGVRLRARDLAARLGVSEGAYVASSCDGETTIRLRPQWESIFRALTPVGRVMALTRNESVVHEKDGVYDKIEFEGMHGIVLNHDIDLRVFPRRWAVGYATVIEGAHGRMMYGLQFFDHTGTAVHKVYARPQSNMDAWHELVRAHAAEEQAPGYSFEPAVEKAAERPDAEIDIAGFRVAWSELKDTHDFFPMMRKFKVSRTQAMRLAPEEFVREVSVHAVERALRAAASGEVPIMVFVGNPGMVQIHSGPVKRVTVDEGWLNVLDPGFNLHCRLADFERAYVVRKPTVDGVVTSVEVFDRAGELIVTLFGERKPGIAELESWRAIVAGL